LTVIEDPDEEYFDEDDGLYVSERMTDAGNVIKVWWRYSAGPRDKDLEPGTVVLISTRREAKKRKRGRRR
jgi:hypothetical protein